MTAGVGFEKCGNLLDFQSFMPVAILMLSTACDSLVNIKQNAFLLLRLSRRMLYLRSILLERLSIR